MCPALFWYGFSDLREQVHVPIFPFKGLLCTLSALSHIRTFYSNAFTGPVLSKRHNFKSCDAKAANGELFQCSREGTGDGEEAKWTVHFQTRASCPCVVD